MGILSLVLREIRHRRLGAALAAASVALAAGLLVASLALLREHDLATARLLAEKEKALKERLSVYEDDVRKLTKNMGFNVLILPRDADLARFYADDSPGSTFPETYAQRLVDSKVATLNHILPSLQQRVKWPERERTVLLVGVRGEVWLKAAGQKPIQEAVAPGKLWLGHELHKTLSLKPGDRAAFMGREFTVDRCQAERGGKDDITVWMNLKDAQDLLNLPGRINAILALECNCATVDRLGEVRSEIAKILPDTQAIEFQSQALARAEARNKAAALAREEIDRERRAREELGRRKETLASVVVPLVWAAGGVWIGFLALFNVRERRAEIGLLRALGVGTFPILALVLARAKLTGLVGAVAGYAAGLAAVLLWNAGPEMKQAAAEMARPGIVLLVLVAAPLLAGVAAWIPAALAARQDPAEVLRAN
jgi:hypothetical protein